MVPADAADHAKEYAVLVDELRRYNPELLDKDRILAITKSDMLDEELEAEIVHELPKDVPHIFISSVTGKNVQQLKDKLWQKLNETNG
jgi:GTP-binding protein